MQVQKRVETVKEIQEKKQVAPSSQQDSNTVLCIYDNTTKEEFHMDQSLNKEEAIRRLSDKIDESFSSKRYAGSVNSRKLSKLDDAICTISLVDRFVRVAEVANKTVVQELSKILEEDPKKYVYERENCRHLINSHNSSGYNAAYVAAKNGNKDVLEYLFKSKAQLKIPSIIKGKYSQQPIEVAARWQHHEVVMWMLDKIQWDQKTINTIYLNTQSKEIRKRIRQETNLFVKLRVWFCRCK